MPHVAEISSIKILPNRQRRDFDGGKLIDLMESIKTHQLLNPIVLRPEGDNLVLVAGERRLRAVSMLFELGGILRCNSEVIPSGYIPFTLLDELSSLAAEEAELEENVCRQDLSWQERADALLRLQRLRQSQVDAEHTSAGIPSEPPLVSAADIAEEVVGRRDAHPANEIRKSLIVARHLGDSEVAKARNVDEAFKILIRRESAKRNETLAAAVGQTFSAESHTLLQGSFQDNSVPAESFDVILSDPPYGMGADSFGDAGGSLSAHSHAYVDSYENWQGLMNDLIPFVTRAAKPQSHLYLFCDIDRFAELRERLASAGWEVHRTPIIWHKPSSHRVPWPLHGPRRQYELIAYAIRGKRPTLSLSSDVITCASDENLGHAAQKPIALLEDLLRRSARPGDSILDPCCGSGSIFPAAHNLKLRATGIELDPAHYGLAIKRLQQLT